MDDGRLTDSKGRTVDFKNTIIIMTSNLGSEYLLNAKISNGEIDEETRKLIDRELKLHFRPEFLNRLDDLQTSHKGADYKNYRPSSCRNSAKADRKRNFNKVYSKGKRVYYGKCL